MFKRRIIFKVYLTALKYYLHIYCRWFLFLSMACPKLLAWNSWNTFIDVASTFESKLKFELSGFTSDLYLYLRCLQMGCVGNFRLEIRTHRLLYCFYTLNVDLNILFCFLFKFRRWSRLFIGWGLLVIILFIMLILFIVMCMSRYQLIWPHFIWNSVYY